jgi:GMP synthase-like glutamine amidotransferase
MKIGILETGSPPAPLDQTYAPYPAMMQQMLVDAGFPIEVQAFDVRAGELPDGPEGFDGFLVTGSPAGVYDDLPWIEPLKAFLQSAKGRTKLVGICFGHQIMAEAFGGRVEKSPKGWGIGLHRYDVVGQERWLDGSRPVSVPVSHQDQVVEVPPGARVVAGSVFTPNGVLAYGDQPAISMQHHPEFSAEYAKALIERRRGAAVAEDVAAPAIASLDAPNDNRRVAGWIGRFLRGY